MKVIDYAVQVVQELRDLPRVYAEATREDKIRLLKGFVSEIKIDENRAIAFVSRPGFSSVMRTRKLVGPGNPPRRAGSGSRQPAPPNVADPNLVLRAIWEISDLICA